MIKKKSLTNLLYIIMMAIFSMGIVSCGSDDNDEGGASSLKGTKWTFTFHDTKYILEFSTASEALFYEADVNNNYIDDLNKGSYIFDGNTIKFNRSIVLSHSYTFSFVFNYYYFETAVISGNTMTLITNEKEVKVTSLSEGTTTVTQKGEKSFTLMKIQ